MQNEYSVYNIIGILQTSIRHLKLWRHKTGNLRDSYFTDPFHTFQHFSTARGSFPVTTPSEPANASAFNPCHEFWAWKYPKRLKCRLGSFQAAKVPGFTVSLQMGSKHCRCPKILDRFSQTHVALTGCIKRLKSKKANKMRWLWFLTFRPSPVRFDSKLRAYWQTGKLHRLPRPSCLSPPFHHFMWPMVSSRSVMIRPPQAMAGARSWG